MLDWSHRMVAMYQFGVTRAVEESAAEAARAFAGFMRAHARARRSDLRDDLISQLLHAESEGGRLSEDELVTTCILLLNAGHEATVHAIGNGVKAMLEHHVDAESAFADEASRAATVEEMLRLDAPLHLFRPLRAGRRRVRGRRASGKARRLGLLLGAANRDPDRFPRPDAFDAGRDPNPASRLRRGHPLLRRGAAGAARDWRSRCRSCSPVCPASGWPRPPDIATPIISMGWRRLRVTWG